MKPTDIVTVTCYGRTTKMERQAAMDEFLDGMLGCDPNSSECSRYTKIYTELIAGKMEVSDIE